LVLANILMVRIEGVRSDGFDLNCYFQTPPARLPSSIRKCNVLPQAKKDSKYDVDVIIVGWTLRMGLMLWHTQFFLNMVILCRIERTLRSGVQIAWVKKDFPNSHLRDPATRLGYVTIRLFLTHKLNPRVG
jgi:hypothetical protein